MCTEEKNKLRHRHVISMRCVRALIHHSSRPIGEQKIALLGTCQKLAGGDGVETEGGSQLFETAEKGGVMKNGPLKGEGHVNMCP